MHKQAVLTFNPKSGKGKATMRASDFADHWKLRTGNELRLRATRSLEDIRIAARETSGRDEIQIFMGGDGTLSESIQGLAEVVNFEPLVAPIGFLPGGTGNSFLRDFGITTYEEARDVLLDAILSDKVLHVDAAHITCQKVQTGEPTRPGAPFTRIMFNIWGVGIISDITAAAIKMRALGSANYTVGALFRIMGHKMYRSRVKLNERDWEELDYNLITVSNSRYTGGAMEIAPEVRVNDGQLFYLRTAIASRFKLLSEFPKVFKGDYEHMKNMYSEMITSIALEAKRPFVMNVDGELEQGWNPVMKIHKDYFKLFMLPSRVKT